MLCELNFSYLFTHLENFIHLFYNFLHIHKIYRALCMKYIQDDRKYEFFPLRRERKPEVHLLFQRFCSFRRKHIRSLSNYEIVDVCERYSI